MAGLRPGLVTTRVPRAVRSRRSQISTVSGTSPLPLRFVVESNSTIGEASRKLTERPAKRPWPPLSDSQRGRQGHNGIDRKAPAGQRHRESESEGRPRPAARAPIAGPSVTSNMKEHRPKTLNYRLPSPKITISPGRDNRRQHDPRSALSSVTAFVPIGSAAPCRTMRVYAGFWQLTELCGFWHELVSMQALAAESCPRSQCRGQGFDPPAVHQVSLSAVGPILQSRLSSGMLSSGGGGGGDVPLTVEN